MPPHRSSASHTHKQENHSHHSKHEPAAPPTLLQRVLNVVTKLESTSAEWVKNKLHKMWMAQEAVFEPKDSEAVLVLVPLLLIATFLGDKSLSSLLFLTIDERLVSLPGLLDTFALCQAYFEYPHSVSTFYHKAYILYLGWSVETEGESGGGRLWRETVAGGVFSLRQHYRGRALALIERTFSSISLSKLEDLLGETDEDALKTILREGWSFDGEKKVVSIKKKAHSAHTQQKLNSWEWMRVARHVQQLEGKSSCG